MVCLKLATYYFPYEILKNSSVCIFVVLLLQEIRFLILFLWLFWIARSRFGLAQWANRSIAVNLLVARKAGFHRRGLLPEKKNPSVKNRYFSSKIVLDHCDRKSWTISECRSEVKFWIKSRYPPNFWSEKLKTTTQKYQLKFLKKQMTVELFKNVSRILLVSS